jgi:hypothetical protein
MNNAKIPPKALSLYKESHEQPVIDDLPQTGNKIVRAQLVNPLFTQKAKSDTLIRSLIRHDSAKLAGELIKLLN